MSTQQFALSGSWSVRSDDGKYELSVPVPGSLMEALERRGDFGKQGLFYRENNRLAEGIAKRAYLFSKSFDLPEGFFPGTGAAPGEGASPAFAESRFFLEADGLDTLASLSLNGSEFGKAANMHRRFSWEIGSLLRPGRNRIEIKFENAIAYIEKKQKERRLWHAYWEMPEYAAQGFNRVRKSHCSFGWDWGPIVPDIGIWRDIKISEYRGARLGMPLVRQVHSEKRVELEISVPIELWSDQSLLLEARLIDPKGRAAAEGKIGISKPLCPEGRATFSFTVRNPEIWWPSGMGGQPLYALEMKLTHEGEIVLDTKSLEIGLRTLGVKREKDEWGESFAFVANGIPFFARGADWIPEDVYLTRPSRESTERLIADAVRANFNCFRVWGGGVYPSDNFYELCDRYGLVIWQDLMFACAAYDVRDPEFMENIRAEVEDNLERIRHHPSLGLICGNNEMEIAFVDWGFPHTKEMRREYLLQYQAVFPEISARIAPNTFYWPASPSSGGDFDAPNDPDRGDTHFWDVWHKDKEFKEYERHYFRFMSEFGFESLPSMKTIESFAIPGDRNLFSPIMEDHQRCASGNEKILSYIAKYYRLPANFPSLVYLSQISQAEALRHGIEHWRRNRGRCMGAIFWQYNDNWPVISWSSVDYYGRWKALQYFARRAFAPSLLSCKVEGRGMEIHLSNEGMEPVEGTVSWRLIDMRGMVWDSGEVEARVPALSSKMLLARDFSHELSLHGEGNAPRTGKNGSLADPARKRLLSLSFEGRREGKSEPESISSLAAFLPYKTLSLERPKFEVRAERDAEGRTVLRIDSQVPALFVELDCPDRDLLFSDNFFHMDGRNGKTVIVERGSLSPEEVGKVLRIRSLRDSYH